MSFRFVIVNLISGGSYYTGKYIRTSGSGTVIGTGVSRTKTVSCVDKRGDCATYALQTCVNPKYTEWVKDNCARTCLCSGGSYYTGRYLGPSGTGTGTTAGSHGQVTVTATPVPTTTASKTTTSTIGTTASTIGTPASTMGTTTSTIGTTTSTTGTTNSKIGTTTSTMGTTTSTMGTTTSTMGTTNKTFGTSTTIMGTTASTMGTTAKKQPCIDDPRLTCDKSVCNTDLKIFCQLTCNRCP
ncbi:uncharacterized protein LOC134690001 [Mytilus trossulus]|uniref:uncharacterized protein LOC134690001 n=1 Tax=Mytilus trossulus TaxID=6551 RepID=UPI003003C7AB